MDELKKTENKRTS